MPLAFAAPPGGAATEVGDADQVNSQQIGPVVDHLLEDARQADRSMRDARVFTSVWDGSGWTITTLQRVAKLVRSCHACDRPISR